MQLFYFFFPSKEGKYAITLKKKKRPEYKIRM